MKSVTGDKKQYKSYAEIKIYTIHKTWNSYFERGKTKIFLSLNYM